MYFANLLLPLVFEILKAYINNTSSKKDDLVLEIVQSGASYLAKKPNNDITTLESLNLNQKQIIK